jgi:hypothetical protein
LAGNILPVKTSSLAFERPTIRGKKNVEQAYKAGQQEQCKNWKGTSGTIPLLRNTKPIFVSSCTILMSMAKVIVIPIPTAVPLMAAINGFLQAKN